MLLFALQIIQKWANAFSTHSKAGTSRLEYINEVYNLIALYCDSHKSSSSHIISYVYNFHRSSHVRIVYLFIKLRIRLVPLANCWQSDAKQPRHVCLMTTLSGEHQKLCIIFMHPIGGGAAAGVESCEFKDAINQPPMGE